MDQKENTQSKIKFTPTEEIQVEEINRRINEFKNGNKEAPMIFLGFPSEVKTLVKKGVLTPYGGKETKRALNWYNLTPYGISVI